MTKKECIWMNKQILIMADNYSSQRLYWHRQRLSHPPLDTAYSASLSHTYPVSPCRYEMPPIIPHISCQQASESLSTISHTFTSSSTATSGSEKSLYSCQYEVNSCTKNLPNSSIDVLNKQSSSEIKSKLKTKMPPLNMSEVIETISTLASTGKMKNSDSDDEKEKSKG